MTTQILDLLRYSATYPCTCVARALRVLPSQNSKGAGVEQRVLQALMVKRFPKIVAQLERADSSVEVETPFSLFPEVLGASPAASGDDSAGSRQPLFSVSSVSPALRDSIFCSGS